MCITVEPTSTVVDDTAAAFSSWSPAELHDAMETHFSHYGGIAIGRFDRQHPLRQTGGAIVVPVRVVCRPERRLIDRLAHVDLELHASEAVRLLTAAEAALRAARLGERDGGRDRGRRARPGDPDRDGGGGVHARPEADSSLDVRTRRRPGDLRMVDDPGFDVGLRNLRGHARHDGPGDLVQIAADAVHHRRHAAAGIDVDPQFEDEAPRLRQGHLASVEAAHGARARQQIELGRAELIRVHVHGVSDPACHSLLLLERRHRSIGAASK